MVGGPLMPTAQTSADGDQIGAINEGFADYLAVWYQMDINDTPDFQPILRWRCISPVWRLAVVQATLLRYVC